MTKEESAAASLAVWRALPRRLRWFSFQVYELQPGGSTSDDLRITIVACERDGPRREIRNGTVTLCG